PSHLGTAKSPKHFAPLPAVVSLYTRRPLPSMRATACRFFFQLDSLCPTPSGIIASMETTPSEPIQESTNPPIQSRDTALAAFAPPEKAHPRRRHPPPSISRVFRLYCIDALSAAQVAKKCRCSKAAVIRRLALIRQKTGLSPIRLRSP